MTTDATTPALRRPYLDDGDVRVYAGDCIEVMAELPAESVDAVVCDPPYALGFMGKEWDTIGDTGRGAHARTERAAEVTPQGSAHQTSAGPYLAAGVDSLRSAGRPFQSWCEAWGREALRVLKPGGHLIAFGGTRTFHRLTCGLEDAGFEIRDCLSFLYGSGFPKSLSPYRDQGKRLCQSIESAPHAVRLSEWLPLASDGVKGPTALAIAEMLPGGGLALLTRTGEADGSSVTTVTPSSVFRDATGISLSTDSSWSECSAVVLNGTNTSITETAARLTTDPRTLRFFSSVTTPPTITPAPTRPGGCSCDACTVVESSSDGVTRWSATPVLTAPAVATSRLAPLEPLGSALKPGWEPAVLARKPLTGTVAANVQTHGTGALNIDGCRIGTAPGDYDHAGNDNRCHTGKYNHFDREGRQAPPHTAGRWPANVVLDETAARMLDDQAGERGAGGPVTGGEASTPGYAGGLGRVPFALRGDTGGPSRFFYTAKASTAERNNGHGAANTHPTVKPVDLMRWLVRLVTPPGGLVLDPFAGSGTTGVAARAEGMRCVLIEREAEYLGIIAGRLSQLSLFGDAA